MKKIAFMPRSGGSRAFQSEEARVLDAIEQAIPCIPESQYTLEGMPRVDSLELHLGFQITETQRDAAFENYTNKAQSESQEPEPQTGETNEAD